MLEHINAQFGRIPFAVVSGSTRESIVKSLTTVGLLDRFPVLVGSEDYERSKPAPDAFLVAAARLGIAPKDCLVFEDTDMGIQAATAAGMASVRIPQPRERGNGTGLESLRKRILRSAWPSIASSFARNRRAQTPCTRQLANLLTCRTC